MDEMEKEKQAAAQPLANEECKIYDLEDKVLDRDCMIQSLFKQIGILTSHMNTIMKES